MATSGSASQTYTMSGSNMYGTYSAPVTFTMSWTRVDRSMEENFSTIRWALSAYFGDDFLGGEWTFDITVNGIKTPFVALLHDTLANKGETKELTSGILIIHHNPDRTKSFTYSAALGTKKPIVEGVGVLDIIPKPATITSATSFNDEENPTITYSNPSGNALEELAVSITKTSGVEIIPNKVISRTGSSYTFEFTNAERAALVASMGNNTTMTVMFWLSSKIDGLYYGDALKRTLSLVNYKPTLSPSVIDTNTTTTALTGDNTTFIKGYSTASFDFGAVVRKQATIAERSIINGTYEENITGSAQYRATIPNVEDDTFYSSVVDSRGISAQNTLELGSKFIPYFKVTCNQTIRLNLDKTITLIVKGKYFNNSFGAQNNSLIIEARHKRNSEAWTAWESITPLISDISNGTYTLNATLSDYDPSGTYVFQCRARDKLSTAASTEDTVTLEPLFDWGINDFNFNVPVSFDGDTMNDFVIETGTEQMGTNGTWYWRKWKNGKAECYGCRNYGVMAVTTAWGSLFRSETFTQTLPSGLFVNTPEVIDISLRTPGGYGGWIVRHEASAPSASNSGSFILVRPAGATLTRSYISFNIVGRWK